MSPKLHVGNLSPTTTDMDLQGLFSEYGNVAEVHLARDRHSRRPMGFAFVTMATPEGALAAIQAIHGKQVGTRVLTVNEVPARSGR